MFSTSRMVSSLKIHSFSAEDEMLSGTTPFSSTKVASNACLSSSESSSYTIPCSRNFSFDSTEMKSTKNPSRTASANS